MYRFKFPNDINKLIDGRTIYYLGKELHMNREHLSYVLHGKEYCDYTRASKIVSKCKPNENVDNYFEKVKEER